MSEARLNGAPAPVDRESSVGGDDKLELRLWLRLLTCSHLIESEVRQRLRERFATTLPRFDLLAQLDRAPEGLTMGELSSRLMVSNGNVTGLAEALVREGLVSRVPEPEDRRSLRLRLTAAGKRAFDAMTPVHEQWIDTMMQGLSRAEMAHLIELLGKLKQSLRQGTRPQ
ncbi:MAG TPA: MarR family transcriptional regulator [Stellaceae bacterium]|nr:MarR family transcriptional regulator [Stellaceae bacterium]